MTPRESKHLAALEAFFAEAAPRYADRKVGSLWANPELHELAEKVRELREVTR